MLERFTVQRTVDDLDALYERCAGEPRFGGRPPRESGYRGFHRAGRAAAVPFWALRLVRPVLLAVAGQRSMTTAALVWFGVSLAAGRARDVIVATVMLAVTSPLLLWYRLRHRGPLFTDIRVTGRHGQPFLLRTFTVEPANRWMRRLPWFITLLTTRHLALFGPVPVPHETAVTVARTDPSVQRRPGIIALRRARGAPAPAPRPPQLPEVHRP